MRLVGATNGTIRVPFLLEGVIEGLLGAGAAIVALLIMKVVVHRPAPRHHPFLPLVGTSDVIVRRRRGSSWWRWSSPSLAGFFATRRYLDV